MSFETPPPELPLESGRAPTQPIRLFAGLRLVSLCTLASRILGMVRDVGMAALFGAGPALDAFTVAFRIPNLVRSLFGEGALTAAFLPSFVRELERAGRPSAWRLASALFVSLAILLTAIVFIAELFLAACVLWGGLGAEANLLCGLTAILLPYVVMVCLVAQISSVMHALGHFTWPALLPIVLNVVWLAGVSIVARLLDHQQTQIYAIAVCVLVGGIVQLAAPLPTLRALGFRFQSDWRGALPQVKDVARAMLPVLVGLSITQLNTLADSVIAWCFSRPADGGALMPLPWEVAYPLESGTASALYFGQRLYQFPLGVFGVALGTVLFPLLARHAERGDTASLREDFALGLKLVLAVGLPASAGLWLLADPITALIFQHGKFDAGDAATTAGMIAAYGIGVWAYCGLLIIQRGFYAVGDRMTPLRVGMAAVCLNLAFNLTLIWFVGARGLALSTSITAILQTLLLTWLAQQRVGELDWSGIGQVALRCVAATAVMGAVCAASLSWLPLDASLKVRAIRVLAPCGLGLGAYLAAAWLLGIHDIWRLFRRDERPRDESGVSPP